MKGEQNIREGQSEVMEARAKHENECPKELSLNATGLADLTCEYPSATVLPRCCQSGKICQGLGRTSQTGALLADLASARLPGNCLQDFPFFADVGSVFLSSFHRAEFVAVFSLA